MKRDGTILGIKAQMIVDAGGYLDARMALQQLTQTLQSLNELSDYLQRHPEALIRAKPQPAKENK